MEISEKITFLRKSKSWSQEQLATKLEVSRQAVYKWEAGISMPEIDKLKKMSKLFDITFNELLDDDIDITQNAPLKDSEGVLAEADDNASVPIINNEEAVKKAETNEENESQNNAGKNDSTEKETVHRDNDEGKTKDERAVSDINKKEEKNKAEIPPQGGNHKKASLIIFIACLVVSAVAVGFLSFFLVRSLLDSGDNTGTVSSQGGFSTGSSVSSGVDSGNDTTESSDTSGETVDSGLITPDTGKFTVTFETNGGTPVSPITVEKGGYVYGNINTTRDGYVLTGWIDESTFKVWDFYNDVMEKDTTLQAVWRKARSVTVTYYQTDSDGERFFGYGNELEPIKLAGAIDDGISGTYQAGWSTVPYGDVEYNLDEYVNFDTDTELYAVWYVEITYYKNDGTSLSATDCVKVGEEFKLKSHYSIRGATLTGLAREPGGRAEYQVGDRISLSEPLDLYYVWTVPVTYHKNDGSGETWRDTATLGQSYVIDHGFYMSNGYRLDGWGWSSTSSVLYENTDTVSSVSSAIDLYAVWSVSVTYHKNEGNDRVVVERVRVGSPYTIANSFSNSFVSDYGRTIIGWSLTSNGEILYDSCYQIDSIDQNYEVYAVWGITISYYEGDTLLHIEKLAAGDSHTVLYEPENLVNKSLLGWSTEKGGSVAYKIGDVITNIQKSITLYPIYGITVTYHHNDGSGKTHTVNVTQGQEYTVDYVFPLEDGLTLKGWALSSDVSNTDILYKNGKILTDIDEPLDLYAYIEVTVTLYANDGTEEYGTYKNALNSRIVFHGIYSNVTDRAIMGWSTSANGELIYGNSEAVTLDRCMVLYAVWSDADEFVFELGNNGYILTKYNGSRSVVHIPARYTSGAVTKIAQGAFQNNEFVEEIYTSIYTNEIGANAFSGCTKLRTVNVRNTSSIDVTAFNSCSALENIFVEWNTSYSSIDGVLYNKEGTRLYKYPTGRADKEYNVPRGTHIIGKYAFFDCKTVERVILPSGVGLVDTSAFEGCSNMVSIDLGDNVNYIEGRAFYGCASLESIVLEHDLYTIAKEAFYGCTSLKSVTAMGNIDLIVWHAFAECEELCEFTVFGKINSIQENAFENCPNLIEIVQKG